MNNIFSRALVWVLLSAALVSFAGAQRVAFINPQGQLVTVAPDGKNQRVLTPPTRRYQFPAWSPAGDELAVIGSGPEGSSVFTVADREGAKVQTLYEGPAGPIYLYWSPDGEKVGVLASGEGGLELQVAGSGGKAQKVASGSPLYWQWSRDSERLLVHTGVLEDSEVAFYTLEGRSGQPLGTPGLFNAPGLSPSGRYLAYAELDSGATRIVLRGNTKENAALRREVPYEGFAALSWSPADDRLAIMNPPAAVRLPYGPVRLLDAETGDLTPLVNTTAVAFFWSPDGKQMAYIAPRRQNDGQVTQLLRAPSLRTASTQSDIAQLETARSETAPGALNIVQAPLLELRVVNVKTGADRLLLPFTPTPLFVDQFLPFFDQYALSHRVWSPDSAALVLPLQSSDGPKVVVVPLSGEPSVLADGEMPFWSY